MFSNRNKKKGKHPANAMEIVAERPRTVPKMLDLLKSHKFDNILHAPEAAHTRQISAAEGSTSTQDEGENEEIDVQSPPLSPLSPMSTNPLSPLLPSHLHFRGRSWTAPAHPVETEPANEADPAGETEPNTPTAPAAPVVTANLPRGKYYGPAINRGKRSSKGDSLKDATNRALVAAKIKSPPADPRPKRIEVDIMHPTAENVRSFGDLGLSRFPRLDHRFQQDEQHYLAQQKEVAEMIRHDSELELASNWKKDGRTKAVIYANALHKDYHRRPPLGEDQPDPADMFPSAAHLREADLEKLKAKAAKKQQKKEKKGKKEAAKAKGKHGKSDKSPANNTKHDVGRLKAINQTWPMTNQDHAHLVADLEFTGSLGGNPAPPAQSVTTSSNEQEARRGSCGSSSSRHSGATGTGMTTPSENSANEQHHDAPMDPLVEAMVHNNRDNALSSLVKQSSSVVNQIAFLLSPSSVFALRQTSRSLLRHFDSRETLEWDAYRVPHYPSTCHAYVLPWDPKVLPASEKEQFRNMLERDLFCTRCQLSRSNPTYDARVKHLKQPLHCSQCHCDHPAILFSPTQRHEQDPTKRVCLGWEAGIQVCEHLRITYSDIASGLHELDSSGGGPELEKLWTCDRHVPNVPGIHHLATTEREHYSPSVSLKRDGFDGTPTLQVMWDANLRVGTKGLKDCTAANVRRWIREFGAPGGQGGTLRLCSHMDFTSKEIEAAFDPMRCCCVTYPGAEKVSYPLVPYRELESGDCRRHGAISNDNPFSPRKGTHEASCRYCGSRVGLSGSFAGRENEPYRLMVEFRGKRLPVPKPTGREWLRMVDLGKYLVGDEESKGVCWCDDESCANHWNGSRLWRVLGHWISIDDGEMRCHKGHGCPGEK